MHAIVEVTSSCSESFRSKAYVGAKLLTISQPTPWDSQPWSPLLVRIEKLTRGISKCKCNDYRGRAPDASRNLQTRPAALLGRAEALRILLLAESQQKQLNPEDKERPACHYFLSQLAPIYF